MRKNTYRGQGAQVDVPIEPAWMEGRHTRPAEVREVLVQCVKQTCREVQLQRLGPVGRVAEIRCRRCGFRTEYLC